MQQIQPGIFYEDSYLGVTVGALLQPHGIIAIDAPLRAEDVRSWRTVLGSQRGGPNRLLVSLDAHPDRTLGTRILECTVVAHQRAAQTFRNRPTIFKGQSIETGAVWETYSDSIGMRWIAPDVSFTERLYLHWGAQEVVLEYHPGPTPGAVWAVIPAARVVFVGDTVVVNQPPFLAQADLPVWMDSLDALLKSYADYVIVGGRGGLATPEDIQKLKDALDYTVTSIEQLAGKNVSPEASQDIAPALLARFNFPAKLRDLYTTRLRYGLYQCFVRRYRSGSSGGQTEPEEEQ